MPALDAIGITTANTSRVAAILLALLDVHPDGDPEGDHVEATLPNGLRLMWDTEELMRQLDPNWQPPTGQRPARLPLRRSTRPMRRCRRRLRGLTKEPWDAFWGQRYALVLDPDGNEVSLFARCSRQVFHVGTSGWSYPTWRGGFYPADAKPADFLRHYAQHFDTVELNTTGYRLPAEDQFARWAEQVPAGFTFAPKLPPTGSTASSSSSACSCSATGSARCGCRCRARDDGWLLLLLGSVDPEIRLAFDFRHDSWAGVELPREVAVVNDLERARLPLSPPARAAVLRRGAPAGRADPRRRSAGCTSGTRTSRPRRRTQNDCASSSSRPGT